MDFEIDVTGSGNYESVSNIIWAETESTGGNDHKLKFDFSSFTDNAKKNVAGLYNARRIQAETVE